MAACLLYFVPDVWSLALIGNASGQTVQPRSQARRLARAFGDSATHFEVVHRTEGTAKWVQSAIGSCTHQSWLVWWSR